MTSRLLAAVAGAALVAGAAWLAWFLGPGPLLVVVVAVAVGVAALAVLLPRGGRGVRLALAAGVAAAVAVALASVAADPREVAVRTALPALVAANVVGALLLLTRHRTGVRVPAAAVLAFALASGPLAAAAHVAADLPNAMPEGACETTDHADGSQTVACGPTRRAVLLDGARAASQPVLLATPLAAVVLLAAPSPSRRARRAAVALAALPAAFALGMLAWFFVRPPPDYRGLVLAFTNILVVVTAIPLGAALTVVRRMRDGVPGGEPDPARSGPSEGPG